MPADDFAGSSFNVLLKNTLLSLLQNFILKRIFYTGCGGGIEGLNGTIYSPMVDGSYPNNANCTYVIRQPEGYRILLRVETFILQEPDRGRCTDVVEIYLANTLSPDSLLRYCGQIMPFSIMSTDREMAIRFRTDFIMDLNMGFSGTYTGVDINTALDSYQGSFSIPRFSNMYPLNSNISYIFPNDTGSSVILTFPVFNFQEQINGTCIDHLRVKVEETINCVNFIGLGFMIMPSGTPDPPTETLTKGYKS
ncbi:hypothetical protein FSP39_007474 [Pinctada imbricata]|uniref:CUB domain-containing protein n=1 Tax=Pinctada imbricata TaxID=66713 RepID=A0AA88YJ91_PINIB|nr:hypothetical protein FSP39_007474 [Pinctada imbricata]